MPLNERSEINLASWNIDGALSDPDRALTVAENIVATGGQVISLQDAYQVDSEQSRKSDRKLEVSFDIFRDAGFDVIDTDYHEDRPYGDDNFADYHFITLIKAGICFRRKILATGTRKTVIADIPVQNTVVRVASVYLNDQNRQLRMTQAQAVAALLRKGMPTAVIGDLNEMHGEKLLSRVLSSSLARAAFSRIHIQNDTLPRLADMASGEVLEMFGSLKLRDADPDNRPTMPSGRPLFQLDHLLVNPDLAVTRFNLDFHPDLSDHGKLTSTVVLS